MRLNKKKLAALAMSAVMAASTMPFPVLAEEFTDMGVATVAEAETTATQRVLVDVEVGTDGKVTLKYNNGDEVIRTAEKQKLRDADCEHGVTYKYVYSVTNSTAEMNGEYTSVEFYEGSKLGHDYQEVLITSGTSASGESYKPASCEEEGLGYKETICTRCGNPKPGTTRGEDEVLAKLEHDYKFVREEVIDPVNVDPVTRQLMEKDKPGSYTLRTHYKCSKCQGETYKDKYVTLKPTDLTVDNDKTYATTVNDEGIDSNIEGMLIRGTIVPLENVAVDKIDESKIVLSDCSKDGTYWVVYKNDKDVVINKVAHTVKKHHVYTVDYFGKTDADRALLKKVYDDDDNLIGVTSNSCYKTANYYEIKTCANLNCEDEIKTEGVAQPSAEHNINDDTKNKVEYAATLAKISKTGALTVEQYENILGDLVGAKITKNNTCESNGTITVSYLCRSCGKETGDTVTINVEKLGHEWNNSVVENKVDATCGKDGSYDLVHTCKVCGKKEVETAGVKIPKTNKHSYIDAKTGTVDFTDAYIKFTGTKVVDVNGIIEKGQEYFSPLDYIGYGVVAKPVIKCETCGEEVPQDNEVDSLVVEDVKKETAKEAGSITLKASWYSTDGKRKVEGTYTVPYYSSIAAYIDRNPEEKPINGLHKDEDGVWRYYENNKVTDFTGIAEYQGGKFFVANGVLCSDAKGLNLYNGEWYFLAGGQIQTQVTGLAMYNGEWFFLTNGKLDRTKSGLVEYDGAKFIIAKGELQRYSGLWQDPADGTWYFAALGQIQEQYTGTAIYDGQTFELVNGKLVR